MFERTTLTTVLVLAVLILMVDIPWLYTSSAWAGEMVRAIQGSALSMKVVPAIIVYLALGYLATISASATDAFALGVSVYAVYDFTNLAILKNYDPLFAIADTLWGGILFTVIFYARVYLKL
jgi:uncharacterized membrane protein